MVPTGLWCPRGNELLAASVVRSPTTLPLWAKKYYALMMHILNLVVIVPNKAKMPIRAIMPNGGRGLNMAIRLDFLIMRGF